MKRPFVYLALTILLACSSAYTQWLQTSGPEGSETFCFAANGEYLFVGTERGVFLSTDYGATWLPTALENTTVLSLAVKRNGASPTSLFAGTSFGVARSTNNWHSWTHADVGLEDLDVRSLAVRDTILFAGTNSGGVFRSTNDGAKWFPVKDGLTNIFVNSLAVIDRNLYAATDSGLFRSSNDGAGWAPLGLAGRIVNTVAAIGATLFAGTDAYGLYRSTDGGTSWEKDSVAGMDPYVKALAVIPPYLFAGGTNGLYYTSDGGASWSPGNAGLSNRYVLSLCAKGPDLFAGTYGGVFRSTDAGLHWTKTSTGMRTAVVEALAGRGGTLYAGGRNGVFRSLDRGNNWSDVANLWAFSMIIDGMKVYLGTWGHVFYSFDDGGTWNPLWLGGAEGSVVALAVNGTELLAGSVSNGVLRVSIPAPGLGTVTTTDLNNTAVYSLAASGTDFFAGTEGGVFRSSNGGKNWIAVNQGLTQPNVHALAVRGSNLYAGTRGGGIFLSTNSGDGWSALESSPTNTDIQCFIVNGDNLFAGTWDKGVFLSSNNGVSWNAVNQGLKISTEGDLIPCIMSLAIVGTELYAGTRGAGVWRRPLSEMVTSTERISGEVPSAYALRQNYPNPFNPTTKIQFAIADRQLTIVKVFDILGREVAILVNEVKEPGRYIVECDGSNLSSGVYFYRLQAGDFTQTNTMLLVR